MALCSEGWEIEDGCRGGAKIRMLLTTAHDIAYIPYVAYMLSYLVIFSTIHRSTLTTGHFG
jgi:hypothetical protein